MPNRFSFGSLLILLSQGWSSFPFRCGSTVIGPDSGAARESQQVLLGGLSGVEPGQEGDVWLPPVAGCPHIGSLGFTPEPHISSRLACLSALGPTIICSHPRWSGRKDLNFRPHVPKTCALPTALHPDKCSVGLAFALSYEAAVPRLIADCVQQRAALSQISETHSHASSDSSHLLSCG